MNYTTYRIGTGQLIRRGYTAGEIADVVAGLDEEGVISGQHDPATQWYDELAGELAPRPVGTATLDRGQIIADAADEATISLVSHGATITIETSVGRQKLTMDGSETLVLTSADPDTLRVKVSNWPDQDNTFRVHAIIGTRVDVLVGALEIATLVPTVTASAAVAPSAGSVVVTGHAPSPAPEPSATSLELAGHVPNVQAGVTTVPAPDPVEITGHAPTVSTT